MNFNYFINFYNKQKQTKLNIMVVVLPHQKTVIKAIKKAHHHKIIDRLILIGNSKVIKNLLKKEKFSFDKLEIIHEIDKAKAADLAVSYILTDKANILMKGLIDTSILLHSILEIKEKILIQRTICHIALMFHKEKDKFWIISDAGINILPNLENKIDIINSSVYVMNKLGVKKPNVALLCAKEKPYDKMPATLDAQKLQQLNKKAKIKNCIVSGPLQFDNAFSIESAKIKGVKDPVAGKADIFIMPNIEAGNIFAKGLMYMCNYNFAGIVMGLKCPMVLTSRSDNEIEIFQSILLSCLVT